MEDNYWTGYSSPVSVCFYTDALKDDSYMESLYCEIYKRLTLKSDALRAFVDQ